MNKLIASALVMANLLATPVAFADSSLSPLPESDDRVSISPAGGGVRPAPDGEDGSTGIILPVIAPELIPPDQSSPIEGGPIIHTPPPPKPPKDDDNGGTDNPPDTNNPDNNTGGGGGGNKKAKKPLTVADMSPELRSQLLNLLRAILALQAAQYPFVSGYTAPVVPEIKG